MISKQIKDLRKQHNYTQEELAEKLNTSRQTISKWEQGISEPDLIMLMQLSQLFSVSTDYLITGSDNSIKKIIKLLWNELLGIYVWKMVGNYYYSNYNLWNNRTNFSN